MRTCPQCGHRDPECWRNHRWMIYVEYCHIDELQTFEPTLAKEILKTGPTEKLPFIKEPFIYALKPSGYVWRMDREDYENYGFFRGLTESWRHAERIATSRAQSRLPDIWDLIENVVVPPNRRSLLEAKEK